MKCPMCGENAEQETVDVGVVEIPCGPHICDYCMWVEPELADFDDAPGGRIMGLIDDFEEDLKK